MRTRLVLAGFLVGVIASIPVAAEDAQAPPPSGNGSGSSNGTGEKPWSSFTGSGLFTLPDTSTLAKGDVSLAVLFENQDRDPLRMDVNDLSAAWTVGVRRRMEAYGHLVVSRAVTVADRTTLLPPPLDIIVPEGASLPPRPYYPLYAPIPYVGRTGTSQVGRFVPGDAVFGAKMRVLEQKAGRPALAVSAELKVPLTRTLSKLQTGAGTGGFDESARVTAEWKGRHPSLIVSAGFSHVAGAPFGDRVLVFRPRGDVAVTELPLRLPNRVSLGLGYRHTIRPWAALIAEATKAVEVGGHTSAFQSPGPLDISAGTQLRRGGLHLTLGLRLHANSVPPFRSHDYPLAGLVDLTSVSAGDLQTYLTAVGAAAAAPYLGDLHQIALLSGPNAPPLPERARILPPTYAVRSHGRIAYLAVVSWSPGSSPKR
jgi:hypothetical protein